MLPDPNQMTIFKPFPSAEQGDMKPQQPDPLGKHEWHVVADQEVAEAIRTGESVSVILLDIDATKAVNDELGHDIGDVLIAAVSGIVSMVPANLRTHKDDTRDRQQDLISISKIPFQSFEDLDPDKNLDQESAGATPGRIGGDEFAILLRDTDEEGAKVVVERLREAIAEYLDRPESYKLRELNVGVSLGAASLKPNMTTSTDLLRVADKAMYEDKMNQLRPLSQEQVAHLQAAEKHLAEAKIRPRDLPRYLKWLGAQAVNNTELV